MPGKRYNKKRNYKRKKNYKRKRRGGRNKALITHVRGAGISDMVYVKLNYVDRIVIDGIEGDSTFEYAFRGNSCFHPDAITGGHQPLYYDQYSLLYDKYRVMGSSIKIDVINSSGTSTMFYAIEPNTDDASIGDVSTFYEQTRSGAPKIVPIAGRLSSKMVKYVSTRRVCGLTKSQMMDDTFASRTNNNPNNVWYWNLFFQSMDGTAHVTGYFMVKITYYVQFYDRLLMVAS